MTVHSQWEETEVPELVARMVPGVRRFVRPMKDGMLQVLVGQEPPGWHLSISHPSRLPNWYEIKDAREQFVPDRVTMALLLPPQAEYVNIHSRTMHLWQVPGDTGVIRL